MEQQPKHSRKDYLTLFTSTFTLSAFTFGGGFVIIPLMRKKFVEQLHWIDEEEMMDLTAIAQSSPGAIAVNASILVGYRVAGVPGALVTVLGTVLPPLIILSDHFFFLHCVSGQPHRRAGHAGDAGRRGRRHLRRGADDGALRSGGKARPACGDAVGRVCCGALFRCERSGHYPGVRRGGRPLTCGAGSAPRKEAARNDPSGTVLELFPDRRCSASAAAMPPCRSSSTRWWSCIRWLTLAQFTDIITISQMTPGPIAINSATFVGTAVRRACPARWWPRRGASCPPALLC